MRGIAFAQCWSGDADKISAVALTDMATCVQSQRGVNG